MKLVVGLGNPGKKYDGTRHNVGYAVVDAVAAGPGVGGFQDRFDAAIAEWHEAGDKVLLMKPETFMNLSGRAVGPLVKKHGLEPSGVWAIHDEMDIPFGKLRIRKGGGSGGNNGVRSLIADLGDQGFVRFRMGVGRPEPEDAVDHLLSPFTDAERERLPAFIGITADAVLDALTEGLEISMNRYNGRSV